MAVTMDKLVALCKSRGFIFPGSEIYGGFANTWDYGPVGVELYNNIKKLWWQKFVTESDNNFGLDSTILMNPAIWKASGHLTNFSDPLMDCKACKARARADDLVDSYAKKHKIKVDVESMDNDELSKFVSDNKIPCPVCGKSDFTPVKNFNLMFKTFQGVTEDSVSTCYLRPETAQGIFVNFNNVARSVRARVPFGICQIGKSFRNEITPGNFIFRVREFEQMEMEFFCKPGTDLQWFKYWKDFCQNFLYALGLKKENLRVRDHEKEELAFYSVATSDFEYNFPFGWGELWGVADRTDYDLKTHSAHSGQNLNYTDPLTNETFVPYVIEPSLGVGRAFLAILCDGYEEEQLEKESRVVMHFAPSVAPYKVAVLPLQKQLSERADKLFRDIRKSDISATYDLAGSIGKRYRRQDEIGTPYCVTIDFDTLENGTVTIRERDSMSQIRIAEENVAGYIADAVKAK